MRVEVVRAWPRRHDSVTLELSEGATVGDAAAASGLEGKETAAYAVFGMRVEPSHVLTDGDRLELLRTLIVDPKEARRRRAGKR